MKKICLTSMMLLLVGCGTPIVKEPLQQTRIWIHPEYANQSETEEEFIYIPYSISTAQTHY